MANDEPRELAEAERITEEHSEAQAEVIDAAMIAEIRQRLDAIDKILATVEFRELLEALHEESEADIAPETSHPLYRRIGRH